MNDPRTVQSLDHPQQLDGEEGRHWFNGELVSLTLLDDVDDIEESAELLVVGHEHSPVLEDVVPGDRHEGRGQVLGDSLLDLSADVELPVIGGLLDLQDSVDT